MQNSRSTAAALISMGCLYFMMGFITCLNDTLVPFFKKGFVLSYGESSLVQFYFFLTYGLISVPAGKIVERVGYQKGMVFGFLISAAGALLFLPASAFQLYALFLAALFVLAIGIVLLQVAANPYITMLGSPKTASARLTLIQGVGSLGTTIAPIFGAYFILSSLDLGSSEKPLIFPYLGIAAGLTLIAVIIFRLHLPSFGNTAKGYMTPQKRSVFAFRNLNFGIPAIFFYVGAEVSIGSFLTNYIADTLHIADKTASRFVSLYWGGMLIGRFIGGMALRYWKPSALLKCVSGVACLFIMISTSTTGYLSVWFMILVGLCNSIMFAIIFSLAISGLKESSTRASGLLSTAICGGAVISLLTGLLKDHSTWFITFLLPLVCYLYILFYGINGHKSAYSQS